MTKRPCRVTPEDFDRLAEHVVDRVLEARREERRRMRKHLGYLVMLLGAASGLITLLVMLWERWW